MLSKEKIALAKEAKQTRGKEVFFQVFFFPTAYIFSTTLRPFIKFFLLNESSSERSYKMGLRV